MTTTQVRGAATSSGEDEELKSFRDTSVRFLTQHAAVDELRRRQHDPVGYDQAYWRQAAELGWTSLLVSEEHGGGSITGSGLSDLAVVARELGRRAAPGPLVTTNLVALALSRAGSALDVLETLMEGSAVAALALSEASGRGDAVSMQARREGDELVLTGIKRPVEAGACASHLLVVCLVDGQLTQVLVPTDTAGLTVEPLKTVDLTRRCAKVTFDEVRVPASAIVGDGGADAVRRLLDTGLVLLAAEQLGTMETVFDMTLQWTFDRYSFGRPLASYQAVKHRFADLKAMLEASRGIVGEAVAAVAADSPDASSLASAAKAYVGDVGSHLMQEGVQLHGGLGVTFEHDVHLYLRRHTLDRALLGTPADHRQRLTDLAEQAEHLDANQQGASA